MTRAASEEGDLRYRPLFAISPEPGHQRLVQLLSEAVIVHSDGSFLYVNSAGVKLLGASSPEELVGRPVLDFVHPEYRKMVKARMARVQEGRKQTDIIEEKLVQVDGGVVEVEVTRVPISYEGKPAVLVVARDVTKRKQVGERLESNLGVLVAIHEAGRVLGSTLDLEEIGKRLLKIMHRVSDLDAAALHLRDKRGRLCVVHAHGPDVFWRVASATPEAQAARRKGLETGDQQLFRFVQQKEDGVPVAGLCLPLVVRDRVIGVLDAYGPEVLTERVTVETLESLIGQAASAIENARLYQELAERERRLQDLIGKLIGAQEKERHRVAYEVHDGLAQVAIAAHHHLQAFAKDYSPGSASDQKKLDHALKLARQTVREARCVVADLRPMALDDFGLAVALRSKVEALRAEGWEIGYEQALGSERLPDEVETALYRVALEALTNVRKHAQTVRAHITLARRAERVCLEVRDWGRGFDRSVELNGSGQGEQVGICGMRERVAMLGGDFTIYSRPGAGTRVAAEVPLSAPERGEGGKQ